MIQLSDIETIKIDKEYPLYPKKLELFKTNLLYVKGNIKLLSENTVGFCGSRNASDEGLRWARDCAEQFVKKDFVIVSGNAKGVDYEAHLACLKAGGKTIFVLPEGIDRFRIRREFREFWNWDKILVISQFQPNALWQPYQAMQRNKTIIAISKVMLAVEAGEKGGTLNAGEQALKNKVPVFIGKYENSNTIGNKILLNKRAKELDSNYLRPAFEAIETIENYAPLQGELI